MSAERRPGGLTALAVLNFVWGGILAIVTLVMMTAGAVTQKAASGDAPITVTHTDASGKVTTETLSTEKVKEANTIVWITTLVFGLITALVIASGVGYLGQKRFLGRTLGNAYALLSLLGSGLGIYQGGIDIVTIILMVYPLLTLLLINTTFKADLVN